MNREGWLHQATTVFAEELFAPIGVRLPDNIRIGVGFPKGRGGKGQHAIGQCFSHEMSRDKHFEIFIHPELDDALRVSDVLIHELVHVAAGIKAGHGAEFRAIATKVGLAGKMTATVASDGLTERLQRMLKPLPKYPHASLDIANASTTAPKKEGTRLLKAECVVCGCIIRITRKWIDEVGLPTCACRGEFTIEGV